MKKWLASFFLLLLGFDIVSKMAAIDRIAPMIWMNSYPFNGIGIFDAGWITFSLNFVTNTGAAWGVFSGYSGLLFALRVAIISGLIVFLLFFNKGKVPSFPLWLIATGAVGNVIDYWAYGHVIDFFHFTFWGWSFPVFNLADSYITLGAIALFFFSKSKRALLSS